MQEENVPGIQVSAIMAQFHPRDDKNNPERPKFNLVVFQGIDTRDLTKIIRERGTMLARIVYNLPIDLKSLPIPDPNLRNLVAEVSVKVRRFQKVGHIVSTNFGSI